MCFFCIVLIWGVTGWGGYTFTNKKTLYSFLKDQAVENLKQTFNLGEKLSKKLDPQSIVLLQGPIGAGKTSFVQGIGKGLSISEDITSPTFALSHHYCSGNIPLIHLDLYRLKNVSSAREIFFSEEEEAFQMKAILVIEWPELIEPLIEKFWKIEISYAQNSGRHYEIRDPKNLLTFS